MSGTHGRSGLLAVMGAFVLSSMLAMPVTATTGWLDPTFGGNGWVRLPRPTIERGLVGLVVAAGSSGRSMIGVDTANQYYSADQAIVLESNGALSEAFSTAGVTWRTFFRGEQKEWLGFFATAGGGVVGVPGRSYTGILYVIELDATGARVRSVAAYLDDNAAISNVVRLPGGSLRMCSFTNVYPEGMHGSLIGFTPVEGTFAPDPALGPSGQRQLETSDCNVIGADTSGHLYLAGPPEYSGGVIDVMRTTTSGTVDQGWSGDGHALIGSSGLGFNFAEDWRIPKSFGTAASPILAAADGSVFVACRVTRDLNAQTWSAAIAKLNPAGEPDPTFDGDGLRAFAPDGGQSRILAMAVDQAGRPVVSVVYNFADGHTRSYLARFTPTGAFDSSFGNGGLVEQTHAARSIAIDAQGRIVTAAWDGTTVIVARRNG